MLRNPALSGTDLTHEFRNDLVGNLFLIKRITHVPGDTYPMESGSSFGIETLAMSDGKIPCGHVLIASDNPIYNNTTNKSVILFKDIVGVMIMKLPNDSLNLNPKR